MAATGEDTLAARAALIVALTESDLRDLPYGGQGSLGLFQQRPSQGWGAPAQVMDPTYATDAFADGSNYEAQWWPPARSSPLSSPPETGPADHGRLSDHRGACWLVRLEGGSVALHLKCLSRRLA